MAREAQTIVANGAQRLSGFILSLSRSAQSHQTTKKKKKIESAEIWSFITTSCFQKLNSRDKL